MVDAEDILGMRSRDKAAEQRSRTLRYPRGRIASPLIYTGFRTSHLSRARVTTIVTWCCTISVCGIQGQVLIGKEPTEDAGYEIRRDALYMREY